MYISNMRKDKKKSGATFLHEGGTVLKANQTSSMTFWYPWHTHTHTHTYMITDAVHFFSVFFISSLLILRIGCSGSSRRPIDVFSFRKTHQSSGSFGSMRCAASLSPIYIYKLYIYIYMRIYIYIYIYKGITYAISFLGLKKRGFLKATMQMFDLFTRTLHHYGIIRNYNNCMRRESYYARRVASSTCFLSPCYSFRTKERRHRCCATP